MKRCSHQLCSGCVCVAGGFTGTNSAFQILTWTFGLVYLLCLRVWAQSSNNFAVLIWRCDAEAYMEFTSGGQCPGSVKTTVSVSTQSSQCNVCGQWANISASCMSACVCLRAQQTAVPVCVCYWLVISVGNRSCDRAWHGDRRGWMMHGTGKLFRRKSNGGTRTKKITHTRARTLSDDVESYTNTCSPDYCTHTIKPLQNKVKWNGHDRFVCSTKDSTLKQRKNTRLMITTIMSWYVEDASTETFWKDRAFSERLKDV